MAKVDRQNEIILASIDAFSRTNYEKATTAMLAREAGVAEGTLYKYFPSKKELFLACCRYIEELLITRYDAIYKEYRGQPLESLKHVAASYLDFVRENPSMRKFLAFVLNNSFDEDFRRELEGFINLNIRATERMLRQAQEKGEVREDLDPRTVAWFYVGGYFTLILMTEMEAEEVEDPAFVAKYMNMLYGVQAGCLEDAGRRDV
ncbi:MAG: TetR/AcrR family transcriptional regulator [Actinobacteria bacterium]|jgi:AcrR family transcriptional regulator|nr:MAG: TetR/AcrR family transcriptional regulator [Actinomycetota bacterium]